MNERRYLTGDADQGRVELVVRPPDGNGDWYISIVPEGWKTVRLDVVSDRPALYSCVRVVTSGARRGQEHVAGAVAALYRAMGGEESAEALALRQSRDQWQFAAEMNHRLTEGLVTRHDEALALLGEDGAALGLVEAIKRRSYLLRQANDALVVANAEIERLRAAALPVSVAEAMVHVGPKRTAEDCLDAAWSAIENAATRATVDEAASVAAYALHAIAILTAEQEQSQ